VEDDSALFYIEPLTPFFNGVAQSHQLCLGVMDGKENLFACISNCAAAFQREKYNPLAVNTALYLAKLHPLSAGLGCDLLHAEKRLKLLFALLG
jgi:hypothetical protein